MNKVTEVTQSETLPYTDFIVPLTTFHSISLFLIKSSGAADRKI